MNIPWISAAAIIAGSALLSACASTEPPKLQATGGPPMHEQDIGGRSTLVYLAPNTDFKKYKKFIVDPVDIYRGADAQFADASEQDKEQLAQFMHSAFAGSLAARYPVVSAPGPDVVRIHLTLAGLENTVAGVGTVSHLLPAGLVLNLANSATGNPGSFSASVTIAGKITDSQSDKLIVSFIQKRFPDAMDITNTVTSLDSQKAAISETAETFRKRVDKIQAGGKATE
jgi:hypothetical protein